MIKIKGAKSFVDVEAISLNKYQPNEKFDNKNAGEENIDLHKNDTAGIMNFDAQSYALKYIIAHHCNRNKALKSFDKILNKAPKMSMIDSLTTGLSISSFENLENSAFNNFHNNLSAELLNENSEFFHRSLNAHREKNSIMSIHNILLPVYLKVASKEKSCGLQFNKNLKNQHYSKFEYIDDTGRTQIVKNNHILCLESANDFPNIKNNPRIIKILTQLKTHFESSNWQFPVYFLYANDLIYGFETIGTDNIYRLRCISDNDCNWLIINYDNLSSIKITNIVDSSQNTILFNCNKNDCLSSVKYKGNTLNFVYDNHIAKIISTDGIVIERKYNFVGEIGKISTFFADDPTSKFVEEKVLDEKGQTVYLTNDIGKKVFCCNYESGKLNSIADENENKIYFGHNNDGKIVSVSTTIDGENCQNLYAYDNSRLTKLAHNNFAINFDYSEQNNPFKISIAGKEYLTTTTKGNETTTLLASGEIYHSVFDEQVKFQFYNGSLLKKDVFNNGVVVQSEDFSNNEEHITRYLFDENMNIIGKSSQQHDSQLDFRDERNEKTGKLESSNFAIGNKHLTYHFNYQDETENLCATTMPTGFIQTISYDKLGRIAEIDYNGKTKQYHYLKDDDRCSSLVSSVWYGENNRLTKVVKFKYDAKGNIVEVSLDGVVSNRYKYDSLSRLIREDNRELNQSTIYQYDLGGNIIQKVKYTFTLTDDLKNGRTIHYIYPMNGWRDQLLAYNCESIAYDRMGNPTTYRNLNLKWSHCGQLDEIEGLALYKYNATGVRISKTVGDVTTKFYLNNDTILAQYNGDTAYFHYGVDGIVGFTLEKDGLPSQEFVYNKNIWGDITGIYDSNNVLFCKYIYDSWGKHVCYVLRNNGQFVNIINASMYIDINPNYVDVANQNPFRFRGYYYDQETGLYYFSNKYYDPDTCRFINTKNIFDIDTKKINGFNLYNYSPNQDTPKI